MASRKTDAAAVLEEALGYCFRERTLLERAATHASFANEAPRESGVEDNERLEFLGDGLLNFLVAELLFETWPDADEGMLSRARSNLVSEESFARRARDLQLGAALRLAAGEERSGGRGKASVLADAFEAVFGAIFLDGGIDAARAAARRLFGPEVAALDREGLTGRDFKTALQERAQAEGLPLPVYRLVEETGPPHERRFVFEVTYGDAVTATGVGLSKKEAQQQAARAALEGLRDGK